MRRPVFALLIAAVGVLGLGISVEAHALLRSSVPPDGATLDRAPSQVSITFTERPDSGLSIIHVYNSGGQRLERDHARALSAHPSTLVVDLPQLPNGVYTVSWTTVSAIDGHVASGAFAFGVGTSPAGAALPRAAKPPATPPPAPLGVAGRWIYYVGLAFLLGGTWIALFAFREPLSRLLRLAGVGAFTAVGGLLIAAESQRETAGVSWRDYFSTSLSDNLIKQIVPLALAALALLIAWRLRGQWQRYAIGAVGLFTLSAISNHALTTHAAASHIGWLMIPVQWAHLTAFTVWIGGLAALLVGVRGLPPAMAAPAVRRFSFVAGFGLAAIGVTGLLRAIDEVGTLPQLISTVFGGLILVKVALFGVLAALGAINHYRNVPRAEWNLRGLRRVGRTELGVAAVVIAVAAVLTSLAPPSYSPAAAAPSTPQIVASGQDLATTVKARLVVAPGYPGSNRFNLTLRDYDTGQPVDASRVSLRFDFPGRPAVGESMLTLEKTTTGTFEGRGTNLSLAGRWSVIATIERGLQSAEVPLVLTTAVPPETISVLRQTGLPDIYTVQLPKNRSAQLYVDSSQSGFYQVHATFFDGKNELAMADGTVISATPATGPTVDLPVARFDPVGHFIAQGSLSPGAWRFDVSASATDGASYEISFQETLK